MELVFVGLIRFYKKSFNWYGRRILTGVHLSLVFAQDVCGGLIRY